MPGKSVSLQSFNRPNYVKPALGNRLNLASYLILLPARTLLILLGQTLFFLFYLAKGEPSPWAEAGKWWTVWGTVADIGILILLYVLTRRSGISIQAFSALKRRDVLLTGLKFFLILIPFVALGSVGGSWLVYGSWHSSLAPGQLYGRQIPLWAILYSFFIWAPIWSVTEELFYNGYLSSQTAAKSGRHWLTLLPVSFWWALQHSFLPLILDWHYVIWRFLVFVPCVLVLNLLYLNTRKLPAVIVAHFLLDIVAVASTISY